MLCQACHNPTSGTLCDGCWRKMRPAADRLIPPGIRLVSAFEHSGPARDLMHRFKYGGLTSIAEVVARILAPRVGGLPLVPVPRVLTRRVRYGIDPAVDLARRIGQLTEQPVLELLDAPWHANRRAGGDHGAPVAGFRLRDPIRFAVALVDDVVTTGATLMAASQALRVENVDLAVSATAAKQVSSLRPRQPM